MTEPLEILVLWDAGRYSPNKRKRMCWQAEKRAADAAKDAAHLAWLAAGGPRFREPVIVDVTIRRGRKLDPDALLACLKPAIDCLFVGRITPDDSERWVTYGSVRQESDFRRIGMEDVIFRVRPRETATADALGDPAAAMEIDMEKTQTESGWAKPKGARAAHFWDGRRDESACGRWTEHGVLRSRYDLGRSVPVCRVCAGYSR